MGIDAGIAVGLAVGVDVGVAAGVDVGLAVGVDVGIAVGLVVEIAVGFCVGPWLAMLCRGASGGDSHGDFRGDRCVLPWTLPWGRAMESAKGRHGIPRNAAECRDMPVVGRGTTAVSRLMPVVDRGMRFHEVSVTVSYRGLPTSQ